MYTARFGLFAFLVMLSGSVTGSEQSIGPNGIQSAGLMLPNGQPLNGNLVRIGQVEGNRPASPSVPDDDANSSVIPFQVTLQDGDMVTANMNIGNGHATRVAGVMISTDSIDSSVPTNGDAPLGVSPNARLLSSAFVTPGADPGYQDALLTTQYLASFAEANPNQSLRIRAINHSWAKDQEPIGPQDGSTLLTLGMDWMTRRYNVLQVYAGTESPGLVSVPTDNYNGITVSYSKKATDDGVWREVSDLNDFFSDAAGVRTSIDLIAPGAEIEFADLNNQETFIQEGTSFAAPHVTGAAALLYQYADFKIADGGGTWLQGNGRRHEVIKAVLMNSADKLKDPGNGKYLGMTRTVLKTDGSTWLGSAADTDPVIPLDLEMGAGHLNVSRAVTQFAPGEFDASNTATRPKIGWDYGSSRVSGEIHKYRLGEIGAGVSISVTMAWDRVVNLAEDLGTTNSYDSGDTFSTSGFTNLDLYVLPQGSDSTDDAVWSSLSTTSTVEHIFKEIAVTGNYEIWVRQQGAVVVPDDASDPFSYRQPYGLAWWTQTSLTATADFNNDGMVDGADLAQWKDDFGVNPDSDANNDGVTDGADFLAWQREFGTSSATPTSAAVPEPAACLLALVGLPTLLRRRRD